MTHNFGFENRVGVLATKHRKEEVIAPILLVELGIQIIVPPNFDTDRFGTFTRDIARQGSQVEAAQLKAQNVLDLTGETLAIASEGSFFAHPAFPYIPCDREIVLLFDKANQLEVIGQELSTETNFARSTVRTIKEALNFADNVSFPQHGVVAMYSQTTRDRNEIFKGITDKEQFIDIVEFILKQSSEGTVHLETDMRAMYNPTRMKAIEKATQNLIEKLNCRCPNCSFPGFDVVERLPGLPCGYCYFPTSLIRSAIYHCKNCNFKHEKLFPTGIEYADPAQCQFCNP